MRSENPQCQSHLVQLPHFHSQGSQGSERDSDLLKAHPQSLGSLITRAEFFLLLTNSLPRASLGLRQKGFKGGGERGSGALESADAHTASLSPSPSPSPAETSLGQQMTVGGRGPDPSCVTALQIFTQPLRRPAFLTTPQLGEAQRGSTPTGS